jgi:hypothetical protein
LGELNNPVSPYNVWMNELEQIEIAKFHENYEELIYPAYSEESFNDSHWDLMKIPTWLKSEFKSFDGVIWFRKSFELSEWTKMQPIIFHWEVLTMKI